MKRQIVDQETGEVLEPIVTSSSRRVINFQNYDHRGRGESFVGRVSKTIPDMALPIKELMRRHNSGQIVKGIADRNVGYFGDDILFPNMNNLDRTERIDFTRSAADQVTALREKLARIEASRKKAVADYNKHRADAKAAAKADDSDSKSKADVKA